MIIFIYLSEKRDALGDLYKNMVNFLSKKEEIILVIPNAYKEEEFSSSFKIIIKEQISIQKNRVEKLKNIYEFIKYIRYVTNVNNVNKFYLHIDAPFLFLIIFFFFFLLKKDYTIWLHDPILHEGSSKFEYIKRWIGYKSYLKFANKLIVSYSNILQEYKLKKIRNKFITLYLPQMKELEFEDIKNDINIKEKYDFIFFGRIEEYKGLDLLLEVFKDEELRNIKLLIVGRGKKDKEIKSLVDERQNIVFINEYVPNRDLAKYIMESKYVILPYKSATGTQTIQIANYYNKMVLATKVGCFIEYIKEGKNGFFIDEYKYISLKKAILDISKCKIDNRQIVLISKEYKKFDLKRISDELINIIKR